MPDSLISKPVTPVGTPAAPGSKAEKTNRLGLTLADYKGAESTLCAGCGHEAITNQIIRAYFDLGIKPHTVAKLSGIGCSSRTPAFFLGKAHGFNGAHGRMAPVAAGVALANSGLQVIGLSGDGDTAAIGMSHFVHTLRRNTDMVYLMENNGVYSLTKGQFSPTADVGSTLKSGEVNEWPPIDCCGLAIELGCGLVARTFSGDLKQLLNLLKIALCHKGLAFIEVLSPCMNFNNHEGSTKSYKCIREALRPLHEIEFLEDAGGETAGQAKNADVCEIDLGQNRRVRLKNLVPEYDPTDRRKVLLAQDRARAENLLHTGLLYYDKNKRSLRDYCNLGAEPLATMPMDKARLSKKAFDEIMASFK